MIAVGAKWSLDNGVSQVPQTVRREADARSVQGDVSASVAPLSPRTGEAYGSQTKRLELLALDLLVAVLVSLQTPDLKHGRIPRLAVILRRLVWNRDTNSLAIYQQ